MGEKERQNLLESARLHVLREEIPLAWSEPYSDMDSIEKSKLIIELTRLRAEDQRRFDALFEKLDAMAQAQVESSAEALKLRAQLSEMIDLMREKDKRIAKLEKENIALKEQRKLSDKKTYGSKSQKSKKKDDGKDHNDNTPDRQQQKDAFDGTEESLGEMSGTGSVHNGRETSAQKEKERRLYRMDKEYRTMGADSSVEHPSDASSIDCD